MQAAIAAMSADITSRSMTATAGQADSTSASIPPGKGEIASFLCWQVNELKKLNVPVILNTTVTRRWCWRKSRTW